MTEPADSSIRTETVCNLSGASFQHPAIFPTRQPRQSLSVEARQKLGRSGALISLRPRTECETTYPLRRSISVPGAGGAQHDELVILRDACPAFGRTPDRLFVNGQCKLLLGGCVSGFGVRRTALFAGLHPEQVFGAGFRFEGPECDRGFGAAAGGGRRHLETAVLEHALVGRDFPCEVIAFGPGEEIAVADCDLSGSEVRSRELDGLEDVFALQCGGFQRTVGIDDAVAAESGVVMFSGRFEIAAVGPVGASLRVFFHQSLFYPVPDVSAQQSGVCPDEFPVVVQSAGGVAHRMGVFAHHHGAVEHRVEGHLFELRGGRIHAAEDIDIGRVSGVAAVSRLLDLPGRRAGCPPPLRW